MTRSSASRKFARPRWKAGAHVFFLAVSATLARAQSGDLSLPSPSPSVFSASRQVQVSWVDIAADQGRRAEIVALQGWDPDSSSILSISGQYVGDCDYRLRLERLPQDNGFGLNAKILAKLFNSQEAIGAPLAIDTLSILEPDIAFPIDPSVAPNISISFTSNINQPPTPLGSIPVTIGGVNTSKARTSTYLVEALNSVVDFPTVSDSLVVRVAGPTTENDSTLIPVIQQKVDTLVVRATSGELPIFNGMTVSFGAGSATAGDAAQWSARWIFRPAGSIDINLECFHGYHIWKSDLPNVDSFTLLGEIRICESKTSLSLLNEDESLDSRVDLDYDPASGRFTFTDFDVHNDFPYRYAVSTFDTRFLGNPEGEVIEGQLVTSAKFYPGRLERDPAKKVYVVPNPYVRNADWEEGGAKVVFTNLPESCTIRIFTEASDHLATLHHGPSESRTTSPTTATWDLKTESGEDLVSGVYIFYVESVGFTQTGKLMVAR